MLKIRTASRPSNVVGRRTMEHGLVILLLLQCPGILHCTQVFNKNKTLGTLAVAAAAKLLQSCLTLCDPRDGSPPDSPVPGILQARTLEWVAISFSNASK